MTMFLMKNISQRYFNANDSDMIFEILSTLSQTIHNNRKMFDI